MAAKKTQLALVLVLIAVALWRWSGIVRTPTVLPDEQVYLRAAQHLGLGESPYDEPGYFYPPPIATFVLAASARLGEIGALQLLRALSLAGLTLAVWLSLLAISCPWWMRLAAGAAYITLAPAVEIATALGNAAGIAAGLVLVGLFSWRRRPLLAGVALGIGLAFKPVAPLAPLLLALHRPTDSTRNHLIAAIVSIPAAALACLGGLRHLPGLLTNARGHSNPYNFSLHKLFGDLGVDMPALLLLALIAVATILVMRRRVLGQPQFLSLVVTTNLVALPILWAHSLLILLPVQLLALELAFATPRSSWRSKTPVRAHTMLAMLAVTATLLAHATGTTYGVPGWGTVIIRAIPLTAIPFLGWFVVSSLDSRRHLLPPGH